MTPKLFTELGLSPESLKAIDKLGFEQAAPIQAEAIPLLMAGGDVVGQSQTGSGKTAAFAIPVIEKTDPKVRAVQSIILCPTRELAVQVAGEFHKLAFFKRGIHALPIYGGQSYERQYQGLRAGAQIVIGTPGRVMDHMNRGTLNLATVKFVVLDEADVMLNMGFREDIEFILQAVPQERQIVFFSATMPRPILDLIERFARQPKHIRIEPKAVTVPTVEQVYYEVDRRFKLELLMRLIDLHDYKLGIIFCNTKRMVDDLADALEAQGYSADRLHGDMSQVMRDRVMGKFRRGAVEFLIATDVAARGIDVDDVQVVINFDLPYDPEDYVHRIGRTGRAGRSGRAVSFAAGRDVFMIRHIERFTRTRMKRARVPSPGEVEEARTSAFADKLRLILQNGEFKRHDQMIEQLLEEGFSSPDISSAILHLLHGGEVPQTEPAERESPRARPEAKPAPAPAPPPERRATPAVTMQAQPVPPAPAPIPAPAPEPIQPAAQASEAKAETSPAIETAATPARPQPKHVPFEPPSAEASPPDPSDAPPRSPAEPAQATQPPATPPAPPQKAAKRPRPAPGQWDRPDRPQPGPQRERESGEFGLPHEQGPRPQRPYGPRDDYARGGYGPRRDYGGRDYEGRDYGRRDYEDRGYERRGPYGRPRDDYGPRSDYGPRGDYGPRRDYRPRDWPERPRDSWPERRGPWQRGRPPEGGGTFRREPTAPPPASGTEPVPAEEGPLKRLAINVGAAHGVGPADVVGAILGETGLPATVVGEIEIHDRHLFVDVAASHARGIVAKLSRANIKGQPVRVKLA